MERNFIHAIENRRSIYALGNEEIVPIKEVANIIRTALYNVPSAFNSQSTRIVLLTNKNHKELWQITKDTLKAIMPAEAFAATQQKIENCFAAGYGTVLFYEDHDVVVDFQKRYPLYADNFPRWSEQTSAMHQFAIWTMLEDAGLGATLQHYNPLIDKQIAERWHIKPSWRLIAQMPFGKPLAKADARAHEPIEKTFLLF